MVRYSLARGRMMDLEAKYKRVRSVSESLCENLAIEDYVVQTMPDVSPTKWHLAHVTWFFETFVLEPFLANYQNFNDRYHYLFNSYYQSAGKMHARPQRGLLSRPTVAEIMAYRQHVDEHMEVLLTSGLAHEQLEVIELGLNHEQQHQELLLTDIKHVLSRNPLLPALIPDAGESRSAAKLNDGLSSAAEYIDGHCGRFEVGHDGRGFGFDNEFPRHSVLLQPHRLSSALVSNAQYLEFIHDGGYRQADWWLSDGWACVNEKGWTRPLYWAEDLQSQFTLSGARDLDPDAPVCHVSLYEADAFARWSGARLPTEHEWEAAAADETVSGNFMESGVWQPGAASSSRTQLFGDAWEWTSSSYSAYPGFKPLAGSLGEYNGKFMCNQVTVRGGSCATAQDHIRASYRSFFYPHQRWQFLGFRLAQDLN